MNKLSNYATTVGYKNGNTTVTYHSTPIVEFDHECIILRTGGWKSVTTKRKMNQAARQFDLGYSVMQKDHAWFVRYDFSHQGLNTVKAFDGDEMVIKRA